MNANGGPHIYMDMYIQTHTNKETCTKIDKHTHACAHTHSFSLFLSPWRKLSTCIRHYPITQMTSLGIEYEPTRASVGQLHCVNTVRMKGLQADASDVDWVLMKFRAAFGPPHTVFLNWWGLTEAASSVISGTQKIALCFIFPCE